jgi:hypothetical protein
MIDREPVLGLWRPTETAAWALTNAAAAALVLTAAYGLTVVPTVEQQLPWMTIAVLGVALSGVANGLWFLAGRRAVGVRLRAVSTGADGLAASFETASSGRPAAPVLTSFVAVEGLRYYHQPGCPLVTGRDAKLRAVAPDDNRAGLLPCGWCQPAGAVGAP